MMLVGAGLLACAATFVLTPLIRRYATTAGIVDNPSIDPGRRLHAIPVPLLGGLAIWASAGLLLVGATWVVPIFGRLYITTPYVVGLLVGSTILMVGGYLDDRYRLPPWQSILFPVAASVVIIAAGIGVHFITRPWGGVWRIDQWRLDFSGIGRVGIINVGVSAFTFLWLMGSMYTTKFLDGLDGLVSGSTAIAAIAIVALSLRPPVLQPDTAILAAIVAGAFLGFLPYNWSPAKIFLGEGGSLLAGFMLGVLAIIAGGKIATTLLVIGVPMLDVVWVILRRVLWERRSPVLADRKHLHFRLLDLGLSVPQAVLLLYALTAALGLAAIFLNSFGKLVALLTLTVGMAVAAALIVWVQSRRACPR